MGMQLSLPEVRDIVLHQVLELLLACWFSQEEWMGKAVSETQHSYVREPALACLAFKLHSNFMQYTTSYLEEIYLSFSML